MRWAACQAIGQMCTDLGPQLQEQQHAAVLPGLMAVMDDFSAPRVQVHTPSRSTLLLLRSAQAMGCDVLLGLYHTLLESNCSDLRDQSEADNLQHHVAYICDNGVCWVSGWH